jgi:hypothetical protein
VLNGQATQYGLQDDQYDGSQGAPHQHPPVAQPPQGVPEDRREQYDDHGRQKSMRVLHHRVELVVWHESPLAKRPSVQAASLRAAAEAGVSNPDHPTHHDQ